MDDDWDLSAVVRSCYAATDSIKTKTKTTAAENNENNKKNGSNHNNNKPENPLSVLSSIRFEEEEDPFTFPNLVLPRTNGLDELEDSYKPFFFSSSYGSSNITTHGHGQNHSTTAKTVTSLVVPTASTFYVNAENTQAAPPQPEPQQQQLVQNQPQYPSQQQPEMSGSEIFRRSTQSQPASRPSRKRKTPHKKVVCHLTAENLSSDLWAWRKYGQKPIKGSPYPRNYYRCSTSKLCTARKQVERSNIDPNIFIVSYAGDHNHARPTHRNSLAGCTRGKFPRTNQNLASQDDQNSTAEAAASSSSPLSISSLSPTTPLPGSTEEENKDGGEERREDDILIPNFAAATNEYLFKAVDDLSGHSAVSDVKGISGGGAGTSGCFGGGVRC